jgi:hypothetical protein
MKSKQVRISGVKILIWAFFLLIFPYFSSFFHIFLFFFSSYFSLHLDACWQVVERVRCVGQVGVAADRDGGEEEEEEEEGVGGEAARLLLRGPGDSVFVCVNLLLAAYSHAARYV